MDFGSGEGQGGEKLIVLESKIMLSPITAYCFPPGNHTSNWMEILFLKENKVRTRLPGNFEFHH